TIRKSSNTPSGMERSPSRRSRSPLTEHCGNRMNWQRPGHFAPADLLPIDNPASPWSPDPIRRGGPAATMNDPWPHRDLVAAVVRPWRR
ncbi:MAG TPA: hypothetical protein VD767_02360, partial [Thermomicrobiales bacterium]|nr:hypothetical protein [Thermomicrobiales bacterium]